ncbi:MAG: GYD domain-containing protein [Actinomycetota bacterium]
MAKYLFTVSYTAEGARGVMKDGGSGRRDLIAKLAADVGGSLESFYFAFGGADVYGVLELPDHETAAALSMTVSASGAASVKTTVLLTPEQIDQATHRSLAYRPPGG